MSGIQATRTRAASLALLLAPAVVLAAAAADRHSPALAVGAVAELLGGLLLIRHKQVWRPPASGLLILLYLMALAWLWPVTRTAPDAGTRLARGGFVLVAVGLLIVHDLARTGLEPRRRAAKLGRRLVGRTRWPAYPAGYAELPEVVALADALAVDSGPGLGLLADARPEVRTAALTAIGGRPAWRPGEAELIVKAVTDATEVGVRVAGLTALRTAASAPVVAAVAGHLRDRVPEVRQAAALALLDGPDCWPLIRDAVRDALADPVLTADGPLPGADRLTPLAACDLTTWAADGEPLATRSTRTLVAYYGHALKRADRPAVPAEVARQVTDPLTPPGLRVELANLLRVTGLMTPDLLDRMTDIDQPGPLRMVAAEMLLAWNPANPDAIDVLRGLGRQSNRETALAIARLLQKYLRLDMGLPAGPLSPTSKPAAEVAKRVLTWATGRPGGGPPAAAAGSEWVAKTGTGPAFPGLKQTAGPRLKPGKGRSSAEHRRPR